MSNVQEIERAIATLSSEQLNELFAWLYESHSQLTDTRIARDVEGGRLDDLIHTALQDEREGRVRPL